MPDQEKFPKRPEPAHEHPKRHEHRGLTPERIQELKDRQHEKLERLRQRMTRVAQGGPVEIAPADRATLDTEEKTASEYLHRAYVPGFGVSPSSNPGDSFYGTLWARDLAHATGNFSVQDNEAAIIDSLTTVFKYQKPDGALPYRVERKRFLLEHTPKAVLGIDLNWLKKIGIDLITRKRERAVYEGEDGGNAEDTIPATIIALGELYINSEAGRQFVVEHFRQMQKAMDQFMARTDPADGLESSKEANPDWADSLLRGNKKLSTINILYARALRMMELMSDELGQAEEGHRYREKLNQVKESILQTLYDRQGGYFRTAEGESRIDATACIFGSLYLLPATEAVRVQETMKQRLTSNSGLRNFDPPYEKKDIFPILRYIGMGGYHNETVWPWITAQNIQVKIKIALEHPDEHIKEQYKQEAVADLIDLAKLFTEAGGAYEVFDPDTRQPATQLRTGVRKYKIPQNLMGNLAAYQSAYSQLKKLGWI